MTPSAQYLAIKTNPLHTERDIECATHYLAWGRVRDLRILAAQVAARRPVDPLA